MTTNKYYEIQNELREIISKQNRKNYIIWYFIIYTFQLTV